jgi:hypothetical protein
MHRASMRRRWAQRLGSAVLAGVVTAGVLATVPAHASSAAQSGDSYGYDIESIGLGSESSRGSANGLANRLANGL